MTGGSVGAAGFIGYHRYLAIIGRSRYVRAMDYPLRLADQLSPHLRALRKQRGLTQAQLGQMLGVGQARVAEIEARPGLISTEQLIQLLSALGATLVVRDVAGTSPAAAPPGKTPPAKKAPSAAQRSAARIAPKKGSW
jgi:HTH-type transcriptional regulator/antitoxin HipB